MRNAVVRALLVLVTGCSAPPSLAIQLQSDLTPPREVDAVDVVITGDDGFTRTEHVPLDAGASLGRARRLVTIEPVSDGGYRVDLTLVLGDRPVAERSLHVTVRGPTVRTVLVTRDCADVVCGANEACGGGRCVPWECSEETPEACGPAECTPGAPCEGTSPMCAPFRCTASGACVALPDDSACSTDAPVCDATSGCVAIASPGALELTATVRPGAASIVVEAFARGATRVVVGASETDLGTPDVESIAALAGGCDAPDDDVTCTIDGLEPGATYHVYAIATHVTATETIVSNLFTTSVPTFGDYDVFRFESGGAMQDALVWLPDSARTEDPPTLHPTILFLHGGTETATPIETFETGNSFLPALLADPEMHRTFGFIVVAPHCVMATTPSCALGWDNTLPIDALDAAALDLPIDPSRVYVSGWSYGALGVWRVAAAHPDRFAAAMPLATCNRGTFPPPDLCNVATIPLWAFEAIEDPLCPRASGTDVLFPMLDTCPGPQAAREQTIVDCSDHCGWLEAYGGTHGASFEGHTDVFEWLLSHSL